MSKGLIVLDKVPQTCQHIRGNKESGCPFGGMVCQIRDTDVTEHVVHGTMPDWCPIKTFPDKLPEYELVSYTDGDGNVSKRTKLNPENCGWNACIDYMLGGTNGKE